MKKILLFVFVAMNGMLFAQKDLAITLNSPSEGQQIEVMEVFQINFTVTNVGSVALNSLDSVFFILLLNSTQIHMMDPNYTYAERPNDVLNPGESYTIERSFAFAEIEEGLHDLCIGINLYEGLTQDITDNANNIGNTDCRSIEIISSDLSLTNLKDKHITINAYPNPTNDILNFQSEKSIESISIFNLQGRLIERWGQQNSINVSFIESGQYFYEVNTVDGVSKGLFMKH